MNRRDIEWIAELWHFFDICFVLGARLEGSEVQVMESKGARDPSDRDIRTIPTVNPLDAAFGAEIHGLDLAAGADDSTMRLLTDTLYENCVLVVRDQHFDEEQFLRFGRAWGTPIPHVLRRMQMPGYPELMTVGNTEKWDKDPKVRMGAALWHTDKSYERVPASATILYCIKAAVVGGETQFCNMARAYESLDEETQARIVSLIVTHKYGRGFRRHDEAPVIPIDDDRDGQLPAVSHPLVLAHPITGRYALYALGQGAYGIEGMSDDEARQLIIGLKDHALQECNIYRHKYRVGDLVIWDNLQTMHSATPIGVATSDADSRLLWRISVRGKPGIYTH